MRILLFLMIFFISGALLVIENNNLALRDSDNAIKFGGIYFSWLGQIISNSMTVTGNAVDLRWLPTNTSVENLTK
ncbi:hypothetical protein COU57_01510 [Candidatus Pacearchaeota archaeon CG10_big_fil_rev_8_21_14_0_10_32_14]|nr:MAG: hypothetical protein COU57_01510 [Candidatus Pacearchaeota archaeon CG10_big_fil_rev_8_21_14_0_10_32_14]